MFLCILLRQTSNLANHQDVVSPDLFSHGSRCSTSRSDLLKLLIIVLCGFPRPQVWPVIWIESKGTTKGLREPSADFYSAMTSLKVLDDPKRAVFGSSPPTYRPQSFLRYSGSLLRTVPSAPITIGINFACIFHIFLNSLDRSWHFPTLPIICSLELTLSC